MPDQHVPALYAVAPSLMAQVKAAVMEADIDPADKVEIIESLQPLPHLKLKGSRREPKTLESFPLLKRHQANVVAEKKVVGQ